MPIFKIKNKKIKQIPIDLSYFIDEGALRDFFADNLEDLLGLKFLDKEYRTKDGRIDTIAIDETGAPVIIEYKWGEKDNILPQGLFYMDWLKENKPLFEFLVKNKFGKKTKINWDNPRLILISQSFDRYTLSAVRQVKNSVELIEYIPYSSELIYLETVYSPDVVKLTEKRTEKGVYDINYHLDKADELIKNNFYYFQEEIKKWPNVEEKIDQKVGITYRTTKSFVRFEFGKSVLYILLREPKYNDPRKMVEDVANRGWGYKGQIKVKTNKDNEYILGLIKQSYESTL